MTREQLLRLAADAEKTARVGYRCTWAMAAIALAEIGAVQAFGVSSEPSLVPTLFGLVMYAGAWFLDLTAKRWRREADDA